jgi:hypothetical protein
VLGEALKTKTDILASSIEKGGLATFLQGLRGLPVNVETFWWMIFLNPVSWLI